MYDEKLDPSFARNLDIKFEEESSSEKCYNFILTTKTNFGKLLSLLETEKIWP